jgi:hypothetical protein
VFNNVEEWGGICYYLIDTENHPVKEIKSIYTGCDASVATADQKESVNKQSYKVPDIGCDFEKHDETNVTLYSHKVLEIIGKVGMLGDGFKQSLYVENVDRGETCISDTLVLSWNVFTDQGEYGDKLKQANCVEVMQGEKLVGYKAISELRTTNNIDKYKVICPIMGGGGGTVTLDKNGKTIGMVNISIIGPYQVPKGSFPVLRYFDTKEECESFRSYMYTKLVRFLYWFACCGTSLARVFFRYIPCPDAFDHIFTDEELYKKYDLTQEQIDLIESLIKDR